MLFSLEKTRHCLNRVWVGIFLISCGAAFGQDFTPPDPARFGNAIETRDLAQAKEWLDQGLDPDYMANRIGTGLMIAAWEGHLPMLALFLERGADINKTNRSGEQALLLAAWKGHQDIVDWLLARGATVNRPDGEWSALHYAAFSGHQDLTHHLLERGANIDARSPNGSTPLMMAIYEGKPELAKSLIERGANTRLRNDWGDGAMEWAMRFNQFDVARQIGSPEEFAQAASRPKESWGEDQRSAAMPSDLEKLVHARDYLAGKGLSLTDIDRNITTLRVRYARERIRTKTPPRAAVLEISARKSAPEEQEAKVVTRPSAPTYRLPPRAPAKLPPRR